MQKHGFIIPIRVGGNLLKTLEETQFPSLPNDSGSANMPRVAFGAMVR